MGATPPLSNPRPDRWLPAPAGVRDWVEALSRSVAERPRPILHPAVRALADLIYRDPIVRMYLTRMIEEVPDIGPYRVHHLRSLDHMLALIDAVIARAPAFDDSALVGTPLNAVLDWAMGTPAGFAAFRHPPINAALRDILAAWRDFLDSPASLHVLDDSPAGWMSSAARAAIGIEDYEHDPALPHWGFASWNDFFTRRFRPGRRPVAEPDNPRIIANACESTPFRIATDVALTDSFWLKSQPYSLRDMLADEDLARRFAGGTVYQAFLSALNYHRWHSPVAGVIRAAAVIPGTYFSELEAEGEDPAGPNNSQGYLTHVATRALILIEADTPAIGLMAVLLVGMGEVSSCRIGAGIEAGRRVDKGEEIGCFQFGGSTHCLIFGPGVDLRFVPGAQPRWGDPEAKVIRLGTHLATVR